MSEFARQAVEGINLLRATARACDPSAPQQVSPAVAPIDWSEALASSAAVHVRDLQASNTFDHLGSDGSWVGDRVTAQGYAWAAVGEVQAAGYASVADVIAGWSTSPPHCATLMSASFTQIGLAKADGTPANTYPNYWTLDLARPL